MIAPPATSAPATGQYIPALTGLRAIAAYLVFLHHYNPAPTGTFAHRLFAQGYIGVTIFFVLSGFLIDHQYADSYLWNQNGSWRRYGQNRFARIVPLYVLLLLLTFAVSGVTGQAVSGPVFWLNLTLLKGFFDAYKFSGIAQSWSLTVELCFYAAAPFLFVRLRRWGVLRLTVITTGSGLVGVAAGGPAMASRLSFVLFYTVFGRSFEFIIGMWLAARWHKHQLPRFRSATLAGLFLMIGCVLWQANLPVLTTNPGVLLWSEVMMYNYGLPVGVLVFLVGILRERSLIPYVLAHPVGQALGRSSYAFYLIHIGPVSRLLQKAGAGSSRWLLFGGLVLVAHGLYVWVEKPLHRRLGARREQPNRAYVSY